MTVFRTATLRTFFSLFTQGVKELKCEAKKMDCSFDPFKSVYIKL